MHDRPGLLVPPTFSDVHDGSDLERVVFGRDEMANLVFALERLVEGPSGRPIERTEFRSPTVTIDAVRPAEDPEDEYVVVSIAGDDALDLGGAILGAAFVEDSEDGAPTDLLDGSVSIWSEADVVDVIRPAEDDSVGSVDPEGVSEMNVHLYLFEEGAVLAPGESLLVSTGPTEDGVSIAMSDVPPDTQTEGVVVARKLLGAPDAEGSYRLSTTVRPYWVPFTMDYDPEDIALGADPGDAYRLTRGLLLDAASLDAPRASIPQPQGEILDPNTDSLPPGDETLRLYEEEVTRSGCEVSRRYQLARWSDGRTYLWSGKRTTIGAGELQSGLRFDILDEPE